MPKNLNLNWLRSFESSARLLSFTLAAQEIGLTQTAVSQHIKALETQLGEDLFFRRPKSLQLTDVGTAYLVSVRSALETIELSTNGLFGPRQEKTIVVRASMALINWIGPKLESFLTEHPNVGIKLVTSLWRHQSEAQPVDIDIILAASTNERPNLRKLADENIVPVAPKNQSDSIQTSSDLLKQSQIHIFGYDDHWGRYLSEQGVAKTVPHGRLATDTSTTAIEMIAAGLGCAVMLERYAKQAIADGRPVAIVGEPVALLQSHYLVQSEVRSEARAEIEVFESWLLIQFDG
jgi:LysR family glycine cleavage system transcriptional activator